MVSNALKEVKELDALKRKCADTYTRCFGPDKQRHVEDQKLSFELEKGVEGIIVFHAEYKKSGGTSRNVFGSELAPFLLEAINDKMDELFHSALDKIEAAKNKKFEELKQEAAELAEVIACIEKAVPSESESGQKHEEPTEKGYDCSKCKGVFVLSKMFGTLDGDQYCKDCKDSLIEDKKIQAEDVGTLKEMLEVSDSCNTDDCNEIATQRYKGSIYVCDKCMETMIKSGGADKSDFESIE